MIAQASAIDGVRAAAAATPGVVSVSPPLVAGNLAPVDATLEGAPDSKAAYGAIARLRAAVHAVPGAGRSSSRWCCWCCWSSSASCSARWSRPLVLIATVILSYLAALGASAVIFDVVFGFAGSDTSLPLGDVELLGVEPGWSTGGPGALEPAVRWHPLPLLPGGQRHQEAANPRPWPMSSPGVNARMEDLV